MPLDPLDPSALLATPEERLQSRLKSASRQLDRLGRSSLNTVARGRIRAEDDSEIVHDLTNVVGGTVDPGPVGSTPSITLPVKAGDFLRIFSQVDMRSSVGGFPGGGAEVLLYTEGPVGIAQRIMHWVNGNFASDAFVTFSAAPGFPDGTTGFGGDFVVPIAADGDMTVRLRYRATDDPNTVAHFINRRLWVERV